MEFIRINTVCQCTKFGLVDSFEVSEMTKIAKVITLSEFHRLFSGVRIFLIFYGSCH